MKVGIYASYFGKDDPKTFPDVESFIDLARELRLDVIDFRVDVGFGSLDRDYLRGLKIKCLKAGLPIGYLASGGHFAGTDEELRQKVAQAKADVEVAAYLGTPMIRLFCGAPACSAAGFRCAGRPGVGDAEREIGCFQEVCDFAADAGIIVGLQNHPSTGDNVLRILRETNRENFTFILDTGQWVGSPGLNRGVGDPDVDIYRFMEQTAPHASHVRAKIYKIDSGREEWLDYPRIVGILKSAGFNGVVSITFEGQDVNDCDDRETFRLAARHLRETIASA